MNSKYITLSRVACYQPRCSINKVLAKFRYFSVQMFFVFSRLISGEPLTGVRYCVGRFGQIHFFARGDRSAGNSRVKRTKTSCDRKTHGNSSNCFNELVCNRFKETKTFFQIYYRRICYFSMFIVLAFQIVLRRSENNKNGGVVGQSLLERQS